MSERILSLLEPSAVQLQSEAQDRTQVITELGNLLFKTGYVRESYVEAALQRESKMPTGLPLEGRYNAAIPHTECEHVIKAGLALATLARPVIFQNMIQPEEGVPVQLVILMALDQPKSQVEMLQEIAGVLQDSLVIEKLMEARDFRDIQKAFT
jgi:PTS system galactitol-specific IIA component